MNNAGSDAVAKQKKSRGRPNWHKLRAKKSERASAGSIETLGAADETPEVLLQSVSSTGLGPIDSLHSFERAELCVATSSINNSKTGLSATAKEFTPFGIATVQQYPLQKNSGSPKRRRRKQRGKHSATNRSNNRSIEPSALVAEADSPVAPEPRQASSWATRLAAPAPSLQINRSRSVDVESDKASKESGFAPTLERLYPRGCSLAASTGSINNDPAEARAQVLVDSNPAAAKHSQLSPFVASIDEATAVKETAVAEKPAARPVVLPKISEERKERWRTKWWELVVAREREASEQRAMARHDTCQRAFERILLGEASYEWSDREIEIAPRAGGGGEVESSMNASRDTSMKFASKDAKWHSFLAPCSATKAVMSAQASFPAHHNHQGDLHHSGSVRSGVASASRRRRLPVKALFDLVCAGDAVGLDAAIAAGACDWDARLSKDQSDGLASERLPNQDESVNEVDNDGSIVGVSSPSRNTTSAFDAWVEEAAKYRIGFTGNAVHLAATVGTAPCLEALLVAFPSGVESKDRTKRRATPLHLAARHGHLAAVKLLLAAGASPDARDKDAETPLHAAVAGYGSSVSGRGQQTALCKLLANSTRHPNPRNKERQTPLHLAAMRGSEDVCRALVHGPGGSDAASSVDASGATPLVLAAQHGRASAVALLLLRTPDGGLGSSRSANDGSNYLSNMSSSSGNRGSSSSTSTAIAVRSALHECAAAGHAATLRVLLQALSTQLGPSSKLAHHHIGSPSNGNWIDSRDPWPLDHRHGDPPLTLALRNGHGACVQLLLEHGANFATATNQRGQSPLVVAATLEGKDGGAALRLLLHHCATLPPTVLRGLHGPAGAAAVEAALLAGAVSSAAALLLRGASLGYGAQYAAGLRPQDVDNQRPPWSEVRCLGDSFSNSQSDTRSHFNATMTSVPVWPSWPPARAASIARLFASAHGRSAQVARDWAAALRAAQEDAESEVAIVELAMVEATKAAAAAAAADATSSIPSPSWYAACRRQLPPMVPTSSTCYADVRLMFWGASARGGNNSPDVLLAHSPLLMARSEYFRASLTNAARSKENVKDSHSDSSYQATGFDMHFQPSAGDPSADTMKHVLKFLYTGDVTYTDGLDSTDDEDDDHSSDDDNDDLAKRSSDNGSDDSAGVDQQHNINNTIETEGNQTSSRVPSERPSSYKPLQYLSLSALADLMMAAHQLLLLRLQRICEHAIGRRLNARSLPLAVHLCSFLDGTNGSHDESPSQGGAPRDTDFDSDDHAAASSMSDLHWFVQSFVRRHPHLVQLPCQEKSPRVLYSKVELPSIGDGISTATVAAAATASTTEDSEGHLSQVSTAESTVAAAKGNTSAATSHLVKLPPYFQFTGGSACCGRQEVLLASSVYLNQAPLWQPSSSSEVEDEIKSNGLLAGTATSMPSVSHVPVAALQLSWKRFQLPVDGPRVLVSMHALPVTAAAALECTPPLSSALLVAAAEDPACGALDDSERRRVLSSLNRFFAAPTDDGLEAAQRETQSEVGAAAQEDQEDDTTALHDQRDRCRALPGANLVAYDLSHFSRRLDAAVPSSLQTAAPHREPGVCDVEVVAADGGRLWAHKAVLAARSHALAASLRFAGSRAAQCNEGSGTVWEVKLDLSTPAARVFLRWLYGAKLPDATVGLTASTLQEMGIAQSAETSTDGGTCRSNHYDAFTSILMELCFVAEELLLPQLKLDAAAALISDVYMGPIVSNHCDEVEDFYAPPIPSRPLQQRGCFSPLLSPHTAASALQLAVVLGLKSLRAIAGRVLLERLDEVRESLKDDVDSEPEVEGYLKELVEMALTPLPKDVGTSQSEPFLHL